MPNQPKKAEKKPASITFSSDDIKLLVITFTGTVLANLVTVMFVGLAIALVQNYQSHEPIKDAISYISFLTLGSIVASVFLLIMSSRWRKGKIRGTNLRRRVKQDLVGLAISLAFLAIYLLLFWVGIASGIK